MIFLDRNPAIITGFASAVLQLFVAFGRDLSDAQTAGINAAVAAAVGLFVAWRTARDRLVPAIVGFGQAVLTLAIELGADLTQQQAAAIMGVLTILLAAFVHTSVTASVAADGSRVDRAPIFPRRPRTDPDSQ